MRGYGWGFVVGFCHNSEGRSDFSALHGCLDTHESNYDHNTPWDTVTGVGNDNIAIKYRPIIRTLRQMIAAYEDSKDGRIEEILDCQARLSWFQEELLLIIG
jgi:hypothetical protein